MFESRNTSKEAYLGKSPAMACIFCSDSCNRGGIKAAWKVAMRTMFCGLMGSHFPLGGRQLICQRRLSGCRHTSPILRILYYGRFMILLLNSFQYTMGDNLNSQKLYNTNNYNTFTSMGSSELK